jgi:hypothetical protein
MITKVLVLFASLLVAWAVDSDQECERSKLAAQKWRKQASELFCEVNAGKEAIQESGGWCLQAPLPDSSSYKRWQLAKEPGTTPSSTHQPVDSGLAHVIKKYTTEKLKTESISFLDLGAGVGQYGRWFNHKAPAIRYRGFDGAGNVESFTKGFIKWIDVTDT